MRSGILQWASTAGLLLAAVAVPLAVRAQNEPMPDVSTVTMRVRQAHPEYVSERADLTAAVAAFNAQATAFNASCKGIDPDDAARLNDCRGRLSALQAERSALLTRLNAFNADVLHALATTPYRPSGNGMVGGTGWTVGYNVPKPTPELVAKSRAMLAEQERLAGPGHDYIAGINFDRYNFVIGIAAETDFLSDLLKRVVPGDEFTEGQFSIDAMPEYASLAGRSFGELACHSNGAMVCLAALRNQDVEAENVVLYGPQITEEGLKKWQFLKDSGQVKSITIVVNKYDPVPPLSLGFADYVKSQLPGGSETYLGKPLLLPGALIEAVEQTAPGIEVHVFDCKPQVSDPLHCHALVQYNNEKAH